MRTHPSGIPGILSKTKLSTLQRCEVGYSHLVHTESPDLLMGNPLAMVTDNPFTSPLTAAEIDSALASL